MAFSAHSSVAFAEAKHPGDTPLAGRLRLLVGVQAGGMNGVDAYAEQVAATAVLAGHEVTLLVTSPAVAAAVRQRVDPRVRVVDLGLEEPGRLGSLTLRLWHGFVMQRLQRGLEPTLRRLAEGFDIAHLNHPALAHSVRPYVQRIFVAAWFYPHAPLARMVETWRHTQGLLPRRLVLTVKALSYYLGDARGYPAADVVVCPTGLLAEHLQAKGFNALTCPPPGRLLETPAGQARAGRACGVLELLAVCGDLSHPRKCMRDALEALHFLAREGRRVRLVVVGRNPKALRAQARRLPPGVEVVFTGPLPQAEVHARLRQAHVFVFPSLYEEWGYAAVEALLAGVPVVTYPVYPFQVMLEGGLGVIAHHCTPESLAQAIERAASSASQQNLAALSSSRFGAKAVSRRLTELWQGSLAAESEAAIKALERVIAAVL